MNLTFRCLTDNAIGLIARPIDFPISDKLSKELESVGTFGMWPGGKQPFEGCTRLRENALLKRPSLRPLPDSWIVHDQSLGLYHPSETFFPPRPFIPLHPPRTAARQP